MYKRILVPLDGSELAEQALSHAAIHAGQFGAEITLLKVLGPLPEPRTTGACAWCRGRDVQELVLFRAPGARIPSGFLSWRTAAWRSHEGSRLDRPCRCARRGVLHLPEIPAPLGPPAGGDEPLVGMEAPLVVGRHDSTMAMVVRPRRENLNGRCRLPCDIAR